jgi:hypothetical protein
MEQLKEFDLSQFDIDKYLKWYEGLTVALQSYPGKKKRLDRLKKACDYLEKRCVENMLLINTFSKKLLEYFNKEKENISPGIRNLIMYTDDILKGGIISALESNPYFIPTLIDWEWLRFYRPSHLKDNKAQYLTEFQRSILKDRDFASLKLDELSNAVFYRDFYENVIVGEPVLKSVIKANTFNDVSGWKFFCNWICEIDYTKWLLEKTKGLERYESIITPTKAGVVLLFYYLSNSNGESLYDAETVKKAATEYRLSEDAIKRKLSEFKPSEITIISSNTNSKRWKLNDIKFAIRELKRIGNKNATNEALKHLEIIEKKINK